MFYLMDNVPHMVKDHSGEQQGIFYIHHTTCALQTYANVHAIILLLITANLAPKMQIFFTKSFYGTYVFWDDIGPMMLQN